MNKRIPEPGPDMDVAILEAVFGFPRRKVFRIDFSANQYARIAKEHIHPYPCPDSKNLSDYMWIKSGKSPTTHMLDAGTIPQFSSDIGSAMQVFERLRQSGDWSCLEIRSDFGYVWDVDLTPFSTDKNDKHEPTVRSGAQESLPYAICVAALKAKV